MNGNLPKASSKRRYRYIYMSHTHTHAQIDYIEACPLCICIGVFSVRFNLSPRIKDKTKLRRAKMLFKISKMSV